MKLVYAIAVNFDNASAVVFFYCVHATTKLKGYSTLASGHLTLISQWNLTNCRYNYIEMQIMYYTEECVHIKDAIGFHDADNTAYD